MNRIAWSGAAAVIVLALGTARADERKFTYSYEAKTLPQGTLEFEQWATLRTGKEEGTFRLWKFREELEYGLTDRLTTALYFNWKHKESRNMTGENDVHFTQSEGVSSEWKYKLTDPSADLIGSLLYGEVTVGSDEYEFEAKAVLSKALGDFTFAYNFVLEAEREKKDKASGGKEWKTEDKILNTAGVSCDVVPGFSVGLEGMSVTTFPENLGHSEHTAYFVGPNVHAAAGRWWGTLTFLKQVDIQDHRGLELDDGEKYQVRLIVGVNF